LTHKHGPVFDDKQYFLLTNSVHEFPVTQLVPFVLHPVKNASHASSVVPLLSVQILSLHLLDTSHPHLPVPSTLIDADVQTEGVEYLSHDFLVIQPAPVVVQVSENPLHFS
jgi:hypothetical protein